MRWIGDGVKIGLAGAILAVGAWLSAAGGAWAESAEPMPPTIGRIVVEAKGVSRIEGRGTPGSRVRLLSRGKPLGEARVDQDQHWHIKLKDGLPPGVHLIQSAANVLGGSGDVLGDEVRISIPDRLVETQTVTYDKAGEPSPPAVAPETRDRAENLAEAANDAFTDVLQRTEPARSAAQGKVKIGQGTPPPSRAPDPAQLKDEAPGTFGVVVDWLKRSARAYNGEIVGKLAEPKPMDAVSAAPNGKPAADRARTPSAQDGISAAEAARRLLTERRAAEAELAKKRQLDAARKAEAEKARVREAARREVAARKAAEELERRQADYKKRIAENLRALEAARKAADADAKDKPARAAQAPGTGRDETVRRERLTFEPITLPGDRTVSAPAMPPSLKDQPMAMATDPESANPKPPRAPGANSTRVATWSGKASPARCETGWVVMRKGRRWYVAGQDDTLWDIAERFYGAGHLYPRIYRVNRSRMPSPHVVRPCQRLRLPEGRA